MSMFVQSKGSAWQQMQSWHAKQKQYAAEFESANMGLVSALTNTFTSAGDGIFEITVRKALAAAKQRADERAALQGVDRLI